MRVYRRGSSQAIRYLRALVCAPRMCPELGRDRVAISGVGLIEALPENQTASTSPLYCTAIFTSGPAIQAVLIWRVAAPGVIPAGRRKFTW